MPTVFDSLPHCERIGDTLHIHFDNQALCFKFIALLNLKNYELTIKGDRVIEFEKQMSESRITQYLQELKHTPEVREYFFRGDSNA